MDNGDLYAPFATSATSGAIAGWIFGGIGGGGNSAEGGCDEQAVTTMSVAPIVTRMMVIENNLHPDLAARSAFDSSILFGHPFNDAVHFCELGSGSRTRRLEFRPVECTRGFAKGCNVKFSGIAA